MVISISPPPSLLRERGEDHPVDQVAHRILQPPLRFGVVSRGVGKIRFELAHLGAARFILLAIDCKPSDGSCLTAVAETNQYVDA
jgi:hypothetical protein